MLSYSNLDNSPCTNHDLRIGRVVIEINDFSLSGVKHHTERKVRIVNQWVQGGEFRITTISA